MLFLFSKNKQTNKKKRKTKQTNKQKKIKKHKQNKTKNNKQELNTYRAVSLLSVSVKIFERLLNDSVFEFFT